MSKRLWGSGGKNSKKSFAQKCKRLWQKVPKDWLAVVAVVVVIGAGIFFSRSDGSQFQGNYLNQFTQPLEQLNQTHQVQDNYVNQFNQPLEQLNQKHQVIDQNVFVGRTCPKGYRLPTANELKDNPGFAKECLSIKKNSDGDSCIHPAEPKGDDCVKKDDLSQLAVLCPDGYKADGLNCIPEGPLKVACPTGQFWDGKQCGPALQPSAPTRPSDKCWETLERLRAVEGDFNHDIEKSGNYKNLTKQKGEAGIKEINGYLNDVSDIMSELSSNNCSVPLDNEFYRNVCENSDYSAHVARVLRIEDRFNDIAYPRADFNCSETFNSKIDVAKAIEAAANKKAPVACVKEGKSLGANVPGNNAKCCANLVPKIPTGVTGTRGTCEKPGNTGGKQHSGPTIISPKGSALADNGRTDRTDPIEMKFVWSPIAKATEYQIVVNPPRAVANNFAVNKTLDAKKNSNSWTNTYFNTFVDNTDRRGWKWEIRAKIDGRWSDWSSANFDLEPVNTDGRSTGSTLDISLVEPRNGFLFMSNQTPVLRWNREGRVSQYHVDVWDKNGSKIVNNNTTSESFTIPSTLVSENRSPYSWQITAQAGNTKFESQKRTFYIGRTNPPNPPVTNHNLDLDVDLETDSHGDIDARVRVYNRGSKTFDSRNIIFRVENLTYEERFDPYDYAYNSRREPIYEIRNLDSKEYSKTFVLHDLPNTGSRTRVRYRVTLFADGKKVTTTSETINYDRDYDPYYPRPRYRDGRLPSSRNVRDVKGIVEELDRGKYILVDEDDKFIAYLNTRNNISLRRYLGERVSIDAYVDRFSCKGSTLSVDDIDELRSRDSIKNSLDDLYNIGAICYKDVDSRSYYDRVRGSIAVLSNVGEPWYLKYVIDLFERGIMKGRNGVLVPNEPIEIAEATRMAIDAADIDIRDASYCSDRGRAWYCEYMNYGEDNDFYSSNVSPRDHATRIEVVRMVMKAFRESPNYRARTFPDLDYRDGDSGYIEAMREDRVIDGYPDGKFRPNQKINRAEVAKIISNAIKEYRRR